MTVDAHLGTGTATAAPGAVAATEAATGSATPAERPQEPPAAAPAGPSPARVMRKIDIGGQSPIPAADPGPAPMLQWVGIADLVIDDRYQRPLNRSNWSMIRSIASAFAWSKFTPLVVAPVEGGRFAVVDGQHRAHAAALCGFETVPAQVVQMDRAGQAAAFVAVNGVRVAVTIWHTYRAALDAGEPWATSSRDAVAAAGCVLMAANSGASEKKPGEIYAVGLIRAYVADGKAEALTWALSGLRNSAVGDDQDMYTGLMLKAWLMAATERRGRLRGAPLSGFFDDFDPFDAVVSVETFMRDRRRSGIATPAKWDLLAAEFGTGLEAAFPAGGKAVAA